MGAARLDRFRTSPRGRSALGLGSMLAALPSGITLGRDIARGDRDRTRVPLELRGRGAHTCAVWALAVWALAVWALIRTKGAYHEIFVNCTGVGYLSSPSKRKHLGNQLFLDFRVTRRHNKLLRNSNYRICAGLPSGSLWMRAQSRA